MFGDLSPDALRRLVDRSAIPMVLASPALSDCPLVYVNDAFLDLTGYFRSEVVGRNCRFLQGPQSEDKARNQLLRAVERHQQAAVAITNYRKNGERFRNFVFLQPIHGCDGTLMFILGSQYEISAPRRHLSLSEHASVLESEIDRSRGDLLEDGRFVVRDLAFDTVPPAFYGDTVEPD